jgi:cysteinyl-tRNA synthetase
LVGDGSVGEDKLQVSSKKYGKTAWEIAAEYTKLFVDDTARLNILPPDVMPKATDHISEQIEMIQALEKNGHTYKAADGIYFDVSTLPDYGKLSGQKMEDKEGGARVDIGDKKNAADFALWKFCPEGEEKRHMEWLSPWGVGFPGWHIECSAMSEKYLGVPFDIHTGGIDHIAVHHENEIAQTAGARGKLEANYWLHNEFLLVDGGKMSKSLGNTYSLDDLEAKGFSPLAFRYFVLGAHYKTPQNFTFDALKAAEQALNNLVDEVRGLDKPGSVNEGYKERFLGAINDDLNTANALAVLWELVKDTAIPSAEKAATILFFDEVFGLRLKEVVATPLVVPVGVMDMLDDRAKARALKDFKKSDEIRGEILLNGFIVEDTKDGQRLRERR